LANQPKQPSCHNIKMLKTRVITALVLLFGFLAALFWLPQWAWVFLTILFAGGAAWEWAGLVGREGAMRFVYALAIMALTATVLIADAVAAAPGTLTLLAVSVLFWIFVVPVWLARKWPIAANGGFIVGFLLIAPTALALVVLRRFSPGYLLATMVIVWVADIAAYFVGRTLGRHKLAPGISPGKSWEGALGGALGVLVYGFCAVALSGAVLAEGAAAMFAVLLLALAALSIVGDLFESLAKRQRGVKDSGSLLPGHGGLLDRVDSLTATLPAIALFSVSPLLRAKLGI
jgi:phosphatidate cytidylyltransferase